MRVPSVVVVELAEKSTLLSSFVGFVYNSSSISRKVLVYENTLSLLSV